MRSGKRQRKRRGNGTAQSTVVREVNRPSGPMYSTAEFRIMVTVHTLYCCGYIFFGVNGYGL